MLAATSFKRALGKDGRVKLLMKIGNFSSDYHVIHIHRQHIISIYIPDDITVMGL